jgi:hypothetical protein
MYFFCRIQQIINPEGAHHFLMFLFQLLHHPQNNRTDDRTLESYQINAGATIHMVLQLRGGSN